MCFFIPNRIIIFVNYNRYDMTKTEQFLQTVDANAAKKIAEVFGDTARFYAAIYLMAQNEHYYNLDKPEGWEQKLKTVCFVQEKTEAFLNNAGLDGKELMADIKGDYLDDFIAYRVRGFELTNEQFIAIIKAIQNQS